MTTLSVCFYLPPICAKQKLGACADLFVEENTKREKSEIVECSKCFILKELWGKLGLR